MRPYLRLVLRPILVMAIAIVGLVEVVFLAEKFTGLMEQVIRRGGSPLDILRLLLWEVPEILDLALPVALLVGVQTAVGRARREGELVVLTAAGAPSRGLVRGVFLVGLAGGLLSFVMAGFIAPTASYLQRVSLHQLTVEHVARRIAAPGESGSTFQAQGSDFVATGRGDGPPALMVRREAGATPWRYAFAGNWKVTGPDDGGQGNFNLGQVTAFGDLPEIEQDSAEARLNRLAAGSVNVGFNMDDVLPALDRTPRADERPVLPLMQAIAAPGAFAMATDPGRVALVWARALLVPTAALLALMAVWGGTVRGVRAAALPLALVALVLADLVVRAWLGGLAAGMGLWVALGAATILMPGLPLLALRAAGEALIRPGRG